MPNVELEASNDLFELAQATAIFADENIEFAFQVVDDGVEVDITDFDITFDLKERAYEGSTAVASKGDSGTEIIDSTPLVDPTVGEFKIRFDGDVSAELWGEYFLRLQVGTGSSNRAKWRMRVLLEA